MPNADDNTFLALKNEGIIQIKRAFGSPLQVVARAQ